MAFVLSTALPAWGNIRQSIMHDCWETVLQDQFHDNPIPTVSSMIYRDTIE